MTEAGGCCHKLTFGGGGCGAIGALALGSLVVLIIFIVVTICVCIVVRRRFFGALKGGELR